MQFFIEAGLVMARRVAARFGWAWPGVAWRGWAGHGSAWPGKATQGKGISLGERSYEDRGGNTEIDGTVQPEQAL